jgi:pectate lyase
LYNTFQGVGKDDYDGLLDIKDASEYITVSWVYFHDSWKTSLVGNSASDNFDRKITYHHNYFNNCNSRMPSYRYGYGHVFNNYYNNIAETGINCRLGAVLRIEYNYFENSANPIGNWDDPTGYWDLNNNSNKYSSCTGNQPTTSTGSFTPPYSYSPHMVDDVKSVVTTYAGVGIITP